MSDVRGHHPNGPKANLALTFNLGHSSGAAQLLGQRLSARDFDRQVAEIQICAAILNGFTALGIPSTVAVG